VFGVKTGYTEAAGRSLVTCCERQGVTLICVTLSDPDDWADHTALYDWAYGLYTQQEVLSADSQWQIPVMGGQQDTVTVAPESGVTLAYREGQEVQIELRLPSFVYAEVTAGQEAGTATVYIDGKQADSVRLIYTQTVPQVEAETPSLWQRIAAFFRLGERKIYTLS
jgi:D-alanyl-D-alanine carboxypeptidase